MVQPAEGTVIQTETLRKEYRSKVAVDDVSLAVREGEIFGLLGPNGAGKTTLVEMLQGLRKPTSGTASVLDIPLTDGLEAIKERIGVVPQSFHTFERLTVRENVTLARDLHSAPLEVDQVLAELDLEEYAEEPFHSLSGGYQRRTGIAMALVSDPEILFLDEPTTGLDPSARQKTWEQIEDLPARGTTVVLTTHYMEEVEYLADRVGLLVDGRIVAVDTVPALIEQYGGAVKIVVRFDGDGSKSTRTTIRSTLESAAQSVHELDHGDIVGVFEDRQAAQNTYSELHELGTGRAIDLVTADMEDVFLELAGKSLTSRGELE